MKARDVMMPHVVTAKPDDSVSDVVNIFLTHGISGVPVIDDENRLVGMVSEGDLIRRSEMGTEKHRSRWMRFLAPDVKLARDYLKSHAQHVRDVMTTSVVTVTEDTPLHHVATLMEKHRIKRVPVMRDDVLVGIITRANLIQSLAVKSIPIASTSNDNEIRLKVLDAIHAQPWSWGVAGNLTVTKGVVEFWGLCETQDQKNASRIVAENTPGVARVEDHRTIGSYYGYV